MNSASKRVGIFQMVMCALLWSIAGLLISFVDGINPVVIAGGRSLFAAIAVIVFMLVTKQKFILSRDSVLSGVLLCGVFLCFVASNKLTTPANAIVLQYTAPIFVLIFSTLFLHKKPRLFDIAAVLLTLLGVVLFCISDMNAGSMLGNFVAIVAGAFFGGMFVAVGNTKGEEKMSGILLAQIFCAVVGLPFLAFTENSINLSNVSLIAMLGVFQLGIPYILYALASNKCSTISCVVISALEPIFNPVWVAIFFPELTPKPLAIASGLFIIVVITLYSVFDEKIDKKKIA